MKTFTIENETNNITIHATKQDAEMVPRMRITSVPFARPDPAGVVGTLKKPNIFLQSRRGTPVDDGNDPTGRPLKQAHQSRIGITTQR